MSDNKTIKVNGTHQSIAVWAVTSIPLFGFFVVWMLLLSVGEFIDGVQGKGCQSQVKLVDAPQSVWNRGGCIVNSIRQVIPSRSDTNNADTAP